MKYFLLALITGVSLFFANRSKASDYAEPLENTFNNEFGLIMPTIDLNETSGASSNVIAIANNNPLNIRESEDNWHGLANPRAKKGFFNFTSPEYGIRAAKIIILNAYKKRGIDTVQKIIETWAPPSENATSGYIRFVERESGLRAGTVINANNIRGLINAMARMESGKYWPAAVIDRGLSL